MRTVYLDTSFLSQLAKSQVRAESVPDVEAWRALLDALRVRVTEGAVLCPACEFPVDEALLLGDLDLTRAVNAVQYELSKGYCFRYWWEIVVNQTADLVLTYMGAQRRVPSSWHPVDRRVLGTIPADAMRADKEDVRQFLDSSQQAAPPGRTYAEQRELEKQDLVHQLFLAPGNFCFPMLARACGVGEHRFPLDFFDSELVDRIPYVDIFSSIRASYAVYERRRRAKGSDLYDTPAIASVLPYCDMVTTDKNLQTHLVRRLRYDAKYAATILAPTTAGVQALLGML